MAKFLITGQKPLTGEIKVLGAKNAAIKMIVAACLLGGETILDNVPDILDISKIIAILEKLGGKFSRSGHQLTINTANLRPENPDADLIAEIRASVVLVGPFLARFGKISIPHPGGCNIGPRPIDLHLWAFRQLEIEVIQKDDFYHFRQIEPLKKEVKITFPKISVGATENIILYGSLQEKPITIENAAIEPEIIDLIKFLKKTGVKIKVNQRTITIQGQKKLKAVRYKVISDRIEAGTFIILAAATKSPLKIIGIYPKYLEALLKKLQAMQIEFDLGDDFIYIKKSDKILPTQISTGEYPDFPTDLQPPMGVLLTQAQGKSEIKENIFVNRLGYLKELQTMGAKISEISNQQAEIIGPTKLKGAKIHSLDLRAGITLLIAALTADGETEILQAENIDRGYEKIEERLLALGAQIKRTL